MGAVQQICNVSRGWLDGEGWEMPQRKVLLDWKWAGIGEGLRGSPEWVVSERGLARGKEGE